MAMAYADIIFLNQGSARVLTAHNSNEASQGLAFGPPLVLPDDYAPQGTPVIGDFNGDGVVDVAWPSYQRAVGPSPSPRSVPPWA